MLEMQAGIIPVRAAADRWTLQANRSTARACEAPLKALADMLGIQPEDIGASPLWVKAGKEQLIVPLTSEAAVRRVKPDAAKLAALKSEDGQSMAYVFAECAPQKLLGRFFFPQGSAMIEDPATGSATANLGGWMIASDRTLPLRFEISQGEYADRPSTLFLEVDAQERIFVSGDVIELGRGTVDF